MPFAVGIGPNWRFLAYLVVVVRGSEILDGTNRHGTDLRRVGKADSRYFVILLGEIRDRTRESQNQEGSELLKGVPLVSSQIRKLRRRFDADQAASLAGFCTEKHKPPAELIPTLQGGKDYVPSSSLGT
jgi:hypothetical protein